MLPTLALLLLSRAKAAGLALPPGESEDAWGDPLALACLDAGSPVVTVRVEAEQWVLVAPTPDGPREARVPTPTTPRGREDVALLAASLLRTGPAVAVPLPSSSLPTAPPSLPADSRSLPGSSRSLPAPSRSPAPAPTTRRIARVVHAPVARFAASLGGLQATADVAPPTAPVASASLTRAAPALRSSAFAGVGVTGRSGLPAAPGVVIGGVVGGPGFGVALNLAGSLPEAPTEATGRLASLRGALLVDVHGQGATRASLAAGAGVTALRFTGDTTQWGVTPGIVLRVTGSTRASAHARVGISLDGGADLREVVLGRDGQEVSRLGALWGGVGLFVGVE